jgi:hypothetical protein
MVTIQHQGGKDFCWDQQGKLGDGPLQGGEGGWASRLPQQPLGPSCVPLKGRGQGCPAESSTPNKGSAPLFQPHLLAIPPKGSLGQRSSV